MENQGLWVVEYGRQRKHGWVAGVKTPKPMSFPGRQEFQ